MFVNWFFFIMLKLVDMVFPFLLIDNCNGKKEDGGEWCIRQG